MTVSLSRKAYLVLLGLILGSSAASAAAPAPLVMLISIDGLKPEAVLEASAHELKLPNLVRFMTDGVYAAGVHGVLPTLTYPSHTTIMTGVSPARHGIYANTTFDPLNKNQIGWYWYAEDIKVMTLWDAAAKAGLATANVYWPVSVAANIRYNLPQIWRTGTEDDLKLQRALATPGLEQELVKSLGRYPGGEEETVAEDEIRAKFAIRLLESKHPQFITVYLTGLDTEQHKSGPFSPESNAVLERIDTVIGSLRAAAEKAAPGQATISVISDHGFAKVDHAVNLYEAFLGAGLLTLGEDHKIASWKAMPWPAGGAAAVMLADPNDSATKAAVEALLKQLASDPTNGIDRVIGHEQIVKLGGFPDAAFFVSLKIGYELGYGFAPPLVSASKDRGMHGYLADNPEMRSSFFLVGPHVAHGKSLGDIDMRQIAPTLAQLMHVKLPDADMTALKVE